MWFHAKNNFPVLNVHETYGRDDKGYPATYKVLEPKASSIFFSKTKNAFCIKLKKNDGDYTYNYAGLSIGSKEEVQSMSDASTLKVRFPTRQQLSLYPL